MAPRVGHRRPHVRCLSVPSTKDLYGLGYRHLTKQAPPQSPQHSNFPRDSPMDPTSVSYPNDNLVTTLDQTQDEDENSRYVTTAEGSLLIDSTSWRIDSEEQVECNTFPVFYGDDSLLDVQYLRDPELSQTPPDVLRIAVRIDEGAISRPFLVEGATFSPATFRLPPRTALRTLPKFISFYGSALVLSNVLHFRHGLYFYVYKLYIPGALPTPSSSRIISIKRVNDELGSKNPTSVIPPTTVLGDGNNIAVDTDNSPRPAHSFFVDVPDSMLQTTVTVDTRTQMIRIAHDAGQKGDLPGILPKFGDSQNAVSFHAANRLNIDAAAAAGRGGSTGINGSPASESLNIAGHSATYGNGADLPQLSNDNNNMHILPGSLKAQSGSHFTFIPIVLCAVFAVVGLATVGYRKRAAIRDGINSLAGNNSSGSKSNRQHRRHSAVPILTTAPGATFAYEDIALQDRKALLASAYGSGMVSTASGGEYSHNLCSSLGQGSIGTSVGPKLFNLGRESRVYDFRRESFTPFPNFVRQHSRPTSFVSENASTVCDDNDQSTQQSDTTSTHGVETVGLRGSTANMGANGIGAPDEIKIKKSKSRRNDLAEPEYYLPINSSVMQFDPSRGENIVYFPNEEHQAEARLASTRVARDSLRRSSVISMPPLAGIPERIATPKPSRK